jgi:quercetin dioxygenase-like cupin family protein
MEYRLQHENETIRVARIALEPGEKVGLHRDEYPRVIVGLKGGTLTRIEADGSMTELTFPAGESVFLEADPIGEMHSAVNGSSELEIIVVELKK